MSNKYTVVGDPHITSKSLDKANQLFDLVEGMGNKVIWLGDFLDTKEVIRGKCLNLLHTRLEQSKLQHYIIVGNHDWFNLECKDHSLKVLKSLPNVVVIDAPMMLEDGVLAIPYIHDKAVIKSMLDANDQNRSFHSMFGHLDVVGFDYGNGHNSESGLTHDDFKGLDCVISGHYHKLQNTGNLTYLGTPFSHSFGEANQDKVIGVWDSATKKLDLFATAFPRHVSMDFTVGGSTKSLEKFIEANKTNHIRIRLFGEPEDVIKLDKSPFGELNIKWENKSEGSVDQDLDVDESLDNKSQFMAWGRDIKGLDDETLQLGLSILEALNAK